MELTVFVFSCTATLLCMKAGSNAQTLNSCGVAPLNSRIVGGTNATAGSWPWQVSVHYNGKHICGGTLIHNQWVVTAAHCILSTVLSRWTLFLGMETQITTAANPNPNEVQVGIQSITVHPNFNNTLFNNDISLMKLSQPVNFTNYIRPICLASSTSIFYTSTACWASGWGNIGSNVALPSPQMLQEVEIPVVGNSQCSCEYNISGLITSQMICAGTAGKGTCQGDSGGPLQCKQGSLWVQAGITSFGVPCATGVYPEVYARVSAFQTWIMANVQGASIGFVTFSTNGTDPGSSFRCPSTAPLPTHCYSVVLLTALTISFPLLFTLIFE